MCIYVCMCIHMKDLLIDALLESLLSAFPELLDLGGPLRLDALHGALGPPHLARQRRVRCVHLLAMLVRRQVFLRVCFRP